MKWHAFCIQLYFTNTSKKQEFGKMKKSPGFTAFELAVSMAIMVVIAALVLPPYLQWLRGYRLRGAVTNLMADMEMAKIRAIRENTLVVVSFENNGYTIFLDNGQPGAAAVAEDFLPAGEVLVKTRKLPAGVSFDLASLNFEEAPAGDATRFNGRGIPDKVNAPTGIPLVNQTGRKTVTINRLGHLSVQ
jgi:Tfp pilus assembly protein FimT